MIFAVDLDDTLTLEQTNWAKQNWREYYEQAQPRKDLIVVLNELRKHGHTIIIHTARPSEDDQVTREWLKKHGVKYDRLVMDKVRADCYIDTHSLKPAEVLYAFNNQKTQEEKDAKDAAL